ncbi:e3 ubiquitin-protein ligase rbbp6 [Anaeramoeba flamelloides]|uniref:E3 ubiquitin-protein ligase rbbp6 n=1 Tax=Anaeramoeba flamelloides TaxID=1746091 RepID=A0ABQ8YQD5_9EUKA|nr:e3 ubiquitin-protein ligase rbbp6 [Anaeramoeba flamelloides]
MSRTVTNLYKTLQHQIGKTNHLLIHGSHPIWKNKTNWSSVNRLIRTSFTLDHVTLRDLKEKQLVDISNSLIRSIRIRELTLDQNKLTKVGIESLCKFFKRNNCQLETFRLMRSNTKAKNGLSELFDILKKSCLSRINSISCFKKLVLFDLGKLGQKTQNKIEDFLKKIPIKHLSIFRSKEKLTSSITESLICEPTAIKELVLCENKIEIDAFDPIIKSINEKVIQINILDVSGSIIYTGINSSLNNNKNENENKNKNKNKKKNKKKNKNKNKNEDKNKNKNKKKNKKEDEMEIKKEKDLKKEKKNKQTSEEEEEEEDDDEEESEKENIDEEQVNELIKILIETRSFQEIKFQGISITQNAILQGITNAISDISQSIEQYEESKQKSSSSEDEKQKMEIQKENINKNSENEGNKKKKKKKRKKRGKNIEVPKSKEFIEEERQQKEFTRILSEELNKKRRPIYLKTLAFNFSNELDPSIVDKFFQAITVSPSIENITFSGDLSDYLGAISKFLLDDHKFVKRVDFSDSNLTINLFEIMKKLGSNWDRKTRKLNDVSIPELILHDNYFGSDCASYISEMINENGNMELLDISGCGIGSEISEIFESLSVPNSSGIIRFFAYGNEIPEDSVPSFIKCLNANNSIEYLHVDFGIDDDDTDDDSNEDSSNDDDDDDDDDDSDENESNKNGNGIISQETKEEIIKQGFQQNENKLVKLKQAYILFQGLLEQEFQIQIEKLLNDNRKSCLYGIPYDILSMKRRKINLDVELMKNMKIHSQLFYARTSIEDQNILESVTEDKSKEAIQLFIQWLYTDQYYQKKIPKKIKKELNDIFKTIKTNHQNENKMKSTGYNLARLLYKRDNANIDIQFKTFEIKIHKFVLNARSRSYFNILKTYNSKEENISLDRKFLKVDQKAMNVFVNYLYTDRIENLSLENLNDFLICQEEFDLFQKDFFIQKLSDHLMKKIKIFNYEFMYKLSEHYKFKKILNNLRNWLAKWERENFSFIYLDEIDPNLVKESEEKIKVKRKKDNCSIC